MKELLITQPDFMETFSCVGAACREHCCKGVSITLDKNRYQRYIKSPYSDIKRIAISHISVTQDSLASWANINPDNQGNCPFLDEQRLCQIYKHTGINALSTSCATYPRVEHIYKNQKIKSMSLSCPEVTRQVLFSADALTLRFSTINQYDYFKASEIVTEERLANRACAALAMNQQENIEENLWAINQFLQSYQAGNDVNKIKMAEIDGLRDALISAMAAGVAVNELQAVDPDTALVKVLLACLGHFMTQLPDIRGKKTLANYAHTARAYFTEADPEPQWRNTWSQQAWPFFLQHTSVLRNYLLYRIHHDQLAMGNELPVTAAFNLVVIDYFYLKLLISTYANKNGQLTEDDIIDIIYSYHACRESTERSSQQFKQELTALAMSDDFPLLSLLALSQ
ncbi:fliB family protein [Yersinia pseudotuberculosis]|uniref:flagellin lysine-N-methylase n=1 Tax=Yersinia pseudotuberculosis TaxID=633 RepID=UPI0005AD52EB|nr:flagellin lysine-N-methylase [Yersinia pseudotuberculosis]AJK15324.1 putative zinc-/iron-chelating domain protein [Yersinia pseudotuberculosis str. PA3606]CFV28353.1 fliB family protein [Yersinia pseudotuberculosis]CNK40289.1 fliB family protein [Yersinia pseudotuberculosis]CNK96718.1 fliB family protein [Yersinia pseudotuberculosis]BCU89733.1 flagellin lysine-N-methylase [Yersinia pseudotuberculosis]